MESRAATRWPYSLQSVNVATIWEGNTGLRYRCALLVSFLMTLVTMMDASWSLNRQTDLPKNVFGSAAPCGRYMYAATPRTQVKTPSWSSQRVGRLLR